MDTSPSVPAAVRFGVLAIASMLVALSSSMTAQPKYSDWLTPENLGFVVNSASNDTAPALSRDGRSLYFQSPRPGQFGESDIWVAQRTRVDWEWGAPVNLAVINTGFAEIHPALSRDGHWLFFSSSRPGGSGGLDIWASYRHQVHDDFAWLPPMNLGPGVNTSSLEQDASFFENDAAGVWQLFFSRGSMNAEDIYVSDLLPNGTFGPGVPIGELNTAASDRGLTIRFDGLEAIFMSNRPGTLGLTDLWASTRETVFDPWSPPENLGSPVNTAGLEQVPELGADRETLYFAANRPGGVGTLDLYVTRRWKKNQADRRP